MRNAKMHSGQIEAANSLSKRVGLAIAAFNSKQLRVIRITRGGGCKDLWKSVNSLQSHSPPTPAVSHTLTADTINEHYASVSCDTSYTAPLHKSGCLPPPTTAAHFNYMQVFAAINKHQAKATSYDGIPPWFIKLAAPFIAEPLAALYNASINKSVVPSQWKVAQITPIPKTPFPSNPIHFRPISVLSPFSTILEKLLLRHYIYPAISHPASTIDVSDQFAFRPTGSTTAALIAIMDKVTTMLEVNPYVHIIALDFSHAFDVVRHSTLFSKLALLPIPDCVFNWLVSFFSARSHRVRFQSVLSSVLNINASVVQGSALGPVAFIANSSDLHCIQNGNELVKYADDVYLLVPASNTGTIPLEMSNINTWAVANNQKLNVSKSAELIVKRQRIRSFQTPPATPDVARVSTLKVLGVILDSNLSFKAHVAKTVTVASQSLYALRMLKSHGLQDIELGAVCQATLVSRLTYASPAWWGSTSAEDQSRLQAVSNRALRWGLSGGVKFDISDLCLRADTHLFQHILHNPLHALHPLLPPIHSTSFHLRKRSHNRTIPRRSHFTSFNFIGRMLFYDTY